MRPIVLFGVLAMTGCTLHVDRATTLKSGFPHGSVYSVDGDVQVAPLARVRKISVVDGDILLGSRARASGLRSVDGRIELDRDVLCTGDVKSVTGHIRLAEGVRVEGDVRTLTGTVDARDAFIGGQLETVAGRVRLSGTTHVEKGILLPRPDPGMTVNNHEERRLPELVIGPGVVVAGPIVAERGAVLKVSRQARIGVVRGVSVQWFDGAAPVPEHGATRADDDVSTAGKNSLQALASPSGG
ncbi:MAG TPA: hypothetical protein VN043_09050 [Rhodanobacter sp.]|nr:hypothetical protein [Rhodanobacter sp.]